MSLHKVIVAYVFTFGGHRAVQDDLGRLVGTQLGRVAEAFAAELADQCGIPIDTQVRTPNEIAGAIQSAGVEPHRAGEKFALIEAEAVDEADAIAWARTLAHRIPLAEPGRT